MEIRNIRHKGLRHFVETGNAKAIPSRYVSKITDIIIFLSEIEDIEEVIALQKYKPHILSGDRQGTYSLHVSRNWRITFCYDADAQDIYDLDYEDYH